MFCKNCGFNLPEGVAFCPQCGAKVEAAPAAEAAPVIEATPIIEAAPVVEPAPVCEPAPAPAAEPAPAFEPAPVYAEAPKAEPVYAAAPATVNNANVEELSKDALIWGILGLAFSCTFFLSLLGIIFSAIAKKKYAAYAAAAGTPSGKGKVGGILARVGLPVGIVMTVFFFIYIILIAALASAY